MGIKKEVIKMIDDMDVESFKGIESADKYYEGWHQALTELRDKVEVLDKLTKKQVLKSMRKNQ